MRLLLDTHALLWWWTDDPHLSPKAREAIADRASTVLVSAASPWELATKHRIGKLGEAGEAVARFDELVSADGFEYLPISYYHCLKAGGYALAHRDPFDRMLAAQSELEGLVLVTCDPVFGLFGVNVLW
ncbi:type II toxin-antitoxin system VapC family toxin [Thauera phenolivorans]|uniref:type II toxin-antitoxin system VapC family toxin n=1 Tax=Thauera phenolivorans TaxID=1792543 RepID=UPI00083B5198|nr:type II toxin-antitoxin system VapC family toxin [Thauera phenolivorans]